MSTPRPTPAASLHTPEELLETARELLAGDNRKLFRGAILEALASLESFVQKTVFPSLAARFSAEFSEWLETKTRMDFDSRLAILAPIATGLPVDKSSLLWKKYKQTRDLRKHVVHGSRKVTKLEVQAVIDCTAEWLAYLGSTVQLEAALVELKKWVENQPAGLIQSPADGDRIVAEFFGRSHAAAATLNKTFTVDGRHHEVDVVLEFGKRKVLVETKFVRVRASVRNRIHEAVARMDRLRQVTAIPQACIVVFVVGAKPSHPLPVEKFLGGDLYVVQICV